MAHQSRVLLLLILTAPLAAQVVQIPDENFDACTSIMVSRGASTDGSVMITYSADAAFMPKLLHHQGGSGKCRRWWGQG